MTSDHPRGMFANQISLHRLARSEGGGGLSPALTSARAEGVQSSLRGSLRVQTVGAGDGEDKVLRLDACRGKGGRP